MAKRNYLGKFREPGSSAFLILLLCGDIVFIILHCINYLFPGLRYSLLDLAVDRGYPELYQYIKFLWIIVLLIIITINNKSLQYIPWVLLFIYFLLDDSLSIHEQAGGLISTNFNFTPPFGLRLQDFGEISFSIIVLIFLLPMLVWAYRSGSLIFRKSSKDIFLLILIMLFFGVFIDMVDIALSNIMHWKFTFIMIILEDGGEMLSLSFILWYIFLMNLRGIIPGYYLCDLIRTMIKRFNI